ncbi:hypothetical protein [Caulobacter soli]|uniref:hypothetical protein n=1 Tax=Caulobacter soli TaxID=2708539 RepID=UPI001FE2DC0C|nr:hypothetical protein [Caulobacter soli]
MLGAPGGLALAEAWLDLPPGPLRHRLAALVQTTAAMLRNQTPRDLSEAGDRLAAG